MIWLSREQLVRLHGDIIKFTGGSDGIRDDGLLRSALASPLQTYDEKELFPSLREKAARLACGLTEFHPFIDGNKRIGAHAMLAVLKLNGVDLTYTQKELSDMFLSLASDKLGYDELLAWISSHFPKDY